MARWDSDKGNKSMARYGYPQCLLAERGRALLGYLIIFTGGLAAMMGVLMIIFSFVILGVVNPYTTLLENYGGKSYMIVYFFCGFLLSLISVLATYYYKKASRSASRSRLQINPGYLLQLLISTIVLSILVLLICGITIGIQITQLDRALRRGLGGVMGQYIQGAAEKRTMDSIQLDFTCCGNSGPEDWYTVQWKSNAYIREADLQRIQRTGVYHLSDVPFSCCDPESSVTPCQHEDINNIAAHGAIYDTLNEDGCQVAMLDYFKQTLLVPAGIFLTSITVLECCNIILMRFLQTSVDNLHWASPYDPDGFSPAYLVARTDGPDISDTQNPLDEGL